MANHRLLWFAAFRRGLGPGGNHRSKRQATQVSEGHVIDTVWQKSGKAERLGPQVGWLAGSKNKE